MSNFTVVVEPDPTIAVVLVGTQGPQGPPGPSGGAPVDTGSRTSPVEIDDEITPTEDTVNRIFIKGPSVNPTISHPVTNLSVILFGCDNTDTVSIDKDAEGFELSGEWVARNGSQLSLSWDGVSKYVEVSRNEI